jgi:hypothetical protein
MSTRRSTGSFIEANRLGRPRRRENVIGADRKVVDVLVRRMPNGVDADFARDVRRTGEADSNDGIIVVTGNQSSVTAAEMLRPVARTAASGSGQP